MDAVSTQPAGRPTSQSTENLGTDAAGAASLWRFLLNPIVAIAVGGFVLALVAAAILLPQLPQQIADEPAAAARWYLTTAASYGAAGTIVRSIGLFDVVHSLLFRLALALLTLIIAVHFADQLGSALAYRRLQKYLCSLTDAEVGPAYIAVARPVEQGRFEASVDPVEAQNRLLEWVRSRFDTTETCRHALQQEGASPPTIGTEFRTLAGGNTFSYYARPLLPLGLMAAMVVVWLFLYFGWELYSPVLAPGETYRSPSHATVISYGTQANSDTASVTVQVAGRTVTETAATDVRARLGSSRVVGRLSESALLVRVPDGASLLVKPGQSEQTDSVGVILPSPGSEESILIPSRSLGLRIVRRTDEPSAFFLELYEGADLRPSRRIDVDGATTATVETNGDPLNLEMIPVPGMSVTVRHIPGEWLLWIAALTVIAGFTGVLMPPSILLARISPWPVDHALVTLYAADEYEIVSATNAMTPEMHAESRPAERVPEGRPKEGNATRG